MGNLTQPTPFIAPSLAPFASTRGWGALTRLLIRLVFTYWLLYSLPVILNFPARLAQMAFSVWQSGAAPEGIPEWFTQVTTYLAYPESWFQQGLDWFAPWISRALLGLDVEPPTDFTGSGDRLYNYCTCFAFLVAALAVTVVWTAASWLWRRFWTHRYPNYDRLHALLRAIVRFHLMSMMIVYGAVKIWCAQFPPITDFQLETKYGDSSPMGLLWRFMQFSQPYTSITGMVEFSCGLLLISRRTVLLGALCSAGATLQVFLLNMCYDVPVKLMSGQLLLMALTLIVPDAGRLFRFFVLGRPTEPRPPAPLLGRWRRLNQAAVVLSTSLFLAFAILSLLQAYQQARTRGIMAPENPLFGRWVGKEFLRDGQKVPFPEQPENPPPQQVKPPTWKGGPGMPAVIRFSAASTYATFMFEDGSGVTYRNTSNSASEMVLTRDGRVVGRLEVSFPEPDTLVLEGPLDGQTVHMTFRRIIVPPKDYLLRSRGLQWVQDRPFNR